MVLDGIVNTLFNPDKGLPIDTKEQREKFWAMEHAMERSLEDFYDYNINKPEYMKIRGNNAGTVIKNMQMPNRQHI